MLFSVKDMMDAVCQDLRGLFAGYLLPNKAGILQEVRVFPQYIPQPSGITFEDKKSGLTNYDEEDYEKNFPGIVVKLGDIVDESDDRPAMSRSAVRLLFGVYDDSPESTAWRDVLSMMEKVRQKWLADRVIARRFKIELPLKTRLLETDTFPVYFGEMEVMIDCWRNRGTVDYVYRGYSNG